MKLLELSHSASFPYGCTDTVPLLDHALYGRGTTEAAAKTQGRPIDAGIKPQIYVT